MFAAIHATKGIIHDYFDEIVNQNSYCDMLIDKIFPKMKSKRVNPNDNSENNFQQDGAPCHTTEKSLSLLHSMFDFVISNKGADKELQWPASSTDLNPLDYWFWNGIKTKIWKDDSILTKDELKRRIDYWVNGCNTTDEGKAIVERNCDHFLENVRLCAAAEGDHFEK